MSITTEKFWVRTLASVTVGVAAVALSGCSILGNITGGTGGNVVEGEGDQTDVFTIEVGDCLNDAGGEGEVSSVPTIACSEPHDSEAYKSIVLDDGDFPGLSTVEDKALAECQPALETFVGIAYDQSVVDFSYYYPTEASWGNGDREILCLAIETDGAGNAVQAVGSLKGAAK